MTLPCWGKMVSLTAPAGAPAPVKVTSSAVVRLLLKQMVVQLPCPLLYAKQFTYGTAGFGRMVGEPFWFWPPAYLNVGVPDWVTDIRLLFCPMALSMILRAMASGRSVSA